MDRDEEVETVKNGAGKVLLIMFDLGPTAGAGVSRVTEIAARTGIHGGDEHEISGVSGAVVGARNSDVAIFERATEGFEDIAAEFG